MRIDSIAPYSEKYFIKLFSLTESGKLNTEIVLDKNEDEVFDGERCDDWEKEWLGERCCFDNLGDFITDNDVGWYGSSLSNVDPDITDFEEGGSYPLGVVKKNLFSFAFFINNIISNCSFFFRFSDWSSKK
jgi:hypothetical protein